MIVMKICRQCGESKSLDQFRKYYQGRSGHYTVCKPCEKINARYRYLRARNPEGGNAEMQQIEDMYAILRGAGMRPPSTSSRDPKPCNDSVAALAAKYADKQIVALEPGDEVPQQLQKWLTTTLTDDPDYYLEKVYEGLKAEFMPVTHIDPVTLLPVRDTKWAVVLDKLLDKFNEYEDEYYDK